MKLSYTSFDVQAAVTELQETVVGLRVNQIYDVDHKTYLIKLQKPDHKAVLVIESASRLHTTEYQWPKSPAPSGFSMKLRKHLRNKRLENIRQLGMDRVVELTFGSGELRHHLIVELYDRGNITLTDHNYTILIILRPRKDDETRLAAHEVYPIDSFRPPRLPPTLEELTEALQTAKPNLPLKKLLNPKLDCGAGWLTHELTLAGLQDTKAGQVLAIEDGLARLHGVAGRAQAHMASPPSAQGYIIHKEEARKGLDGSAAAPLLVQQEFHPALFTQHCQLPHTCYDSFCKAVDEFYQQLEEGKLQQKFVQQEREAIKKLENVRSDHSQRIAALEGAQRQDTNRGRLIELNSSLVTEAITQVRAALAHQLDWRQIEEMLEEAKDREEAVALSITALKLAANTVTMSLSDPYAAYEDGYLLDSDEEGEADNTQDEDYLPTMSVEIDLDMTAHANARRYFTQRRAAGVKVGKTVAASHAALKSATRKTQAQIKDVHTAHNINKVRKVHWFEKFLWFISSENYLVLAGHDQQQNEVLVKRQLRPNDVYVHGDLHGAASVVIKNTGVGEVPPATLLQAGCMALCNSRAWDHKIVTSAWWVWGHQVSKTAPSGEYLTTGSFMVRGKKNFLQHSHLVYGFGFLFRLEESSLQNHVSERRKNRLAEGKEEVKEEPKEEVEEGETGVEEEDAPGGDGNGEDSESSDEEADQKPRVRFEEDHGESSGSEEEEPASGVDGLDVETKLKLEAVEDDSEMEFPDTVVEMKQIHGGTFAVQASSAVSSADSKSGQQEPKHTKQKSQQQGKAQQNNKGKTHNDCNKKLTDSRGKDEEEDVEKSVKNVAMKRGQRAKLRKMRNKYKDQDEEEREMMMKLLKADGAEKPPKRAAKKRKFKKSGKPNVNIISVEEDAGAATTSATAIDDPAPETPSEQAPDAANFGAEREAGDDDDEEGPIGDDLAILNEFTGEPLLEDELLYAIPVCAPYQALTSYKYKVKMMPGPGKKGKACKTALALFLQQKPTVVREGDLIKALRDTDMARNLPGKVKVSAPNISKVKK